MDNNPPMALPNGYVYSKDVRNKEKKKTNFIKRQILIVFFSLGYGRNGSK